MKNIETILKEHGVELPEAERDAILKDVNANYKTIAEYTKLTDSLANEKKKAEEATEALKKFDGLDPEAQKTAIADLEKKLADREKEFADTLAKRDFDEALAKALDEYKFTSKAAKASIAEKVRKAELKYRDGTILGLNDLMEQIKAEDADAFESAAGGAAKITEKGTGKGTGTGMTREEIFAIKDATQRQAAIAQNPQLFPKK